MPKLSTPLTKSEVYALAIVEGRKRGLPRPGFQRFARQHPAFRRRLQSVIRAVLQGTPKDQERACVRAWVTAIECIGARKGGRR